MIYNKYSKVTFLQDLIKLFRAAIDKHNELMGLGMMNAGCDRHLFGLLMVAREVLKLEKLPEIFTDPAFSKRSVTLPKSLKGMKIIPSL